ncbi:efflux RND transporter permease subunit [Aurantiacibacter gangjinensis]|uniref:Transporter n=1 Tax=Aurantiacibacter gangjinensis TaxID=502682 RepID=A0A0G9MLP0_9SPHN|nr:efflux RND transporter permease subunit [Aurantiacibacter gangjinensis]APE27576.1 RND multidrug efflux transporter; Acriflavin resistance protein [Aurantiacibacter gangjinensis]KLE31616.1 transporter [Aurantiacibacter gangjinensis]
MDFSQISAWSIRNPIVPILAFIALMIAGIMSFQQMDIQDNPDIEFPVVIVSISQPGAAPPEVENQITQRVEAAVQTLDGVENIRSTASEGNTFTVIEFAIGTDIAEAVNEVKSEIDNIRGELPDGILEPRVFKELTSSQPIVSFGVSADDMTLEQLSWFIDDTVTKELLTVNGLAEVSRSGGVDREILVILDPARMQSLGVTASQVNGALRQLNINAAGGQAEIAGSRQSVRVLGNAEDAYELSQTQIPLGGGRTVKLADIATVQDAFGEVNTIAKVNGRQVVTFSITRARGESDVRVYDGAVEALERVQEANPGITFTRLFTSVDYTKDQYESSMALLIEGAVLAVFVVFLFLRDWRATIIAAIAIPLSAIPTFYFMEAWFGFSLNTLSLLALGLVAGVLVDDAIVEIENIVRHMRMGKSAYQASIDAADEIGLPVVATTFCIVAVFLPVGLMPGISGQFFQNFGITVVVAVLMSLAVARMITPMAAAYFLKAKGHAVHGEGPMMDRYMRVLRWSLDTRAFAAARERIGHVGPSRLLPIVGFVVAAFVLLIFIAGDLGVLPESSSTEALSDEESATSGPWWAYFVWPVLFGLGAYIAASILAMIVGLMVSLTSARGSLFARRARYRAARFLDHRVWMMLVGVASLALTVIIAGSLPTQFFPDNDSDFSRVSINMVPGTTLEQTEAVVDQVAARLSEEQEVAIALGIANEGSGRISLVLRDDRARSSLDFERELTPVLQDIPDARVNFQNNQGGGGGTGRAISIMLSGSDPELLFETANSLVEQMETIDGAVAPRIDYDLQRPELLIEPREDLAASLGVTTAALSQTIRIATLGDIDQNAARFSLSDRQIPIRVRLAEGDRRNLSTIRNLPVQTANGGSVPLSRVAEISLGMGPTSIERVNQNRRVFVGLDIGPDAARGDVRSAIDNLPIMQNLPTGVSNSPVGADEWQIDLINNFITAVITGFFLVFAVLVLLYRRVVSPLVNMTSLLLAPLGGFVALYVAGWITGVGTGDFSPLPISMPVFIGMLMLLGIVAKNSILLIDFAIEEMEAGANKLAAIIEAGHKRAQPIVMTTVAMTAGMVPTALSLTGDSAWRAPMGTVVIGGLLLSTVLTLLIVPAGFSLADGLEKKLGPWLRERLLTYKPGDENITGQEPQAAE